MKDTFIFTEGYNCGLILKKCIQTYHAYHDQEINIFASQEDFKHILYHKNNIFHDIDEYKDIAQSYKNGHEGTANLFSKVIDNTLTNCKKIIHFDSDIVFRKESVNTILEKLNNGYDLVGPYRCYKNNLNGRTDLNDLTDVVQTYIFGFNKEKIDPHPLLLFMCQGLYNPYNHPILDFFDPVSFSILKNKGKVFFLDPNDYGGMDENGNKNNKYGILNETIDFGNKLMHFAGVGSGMSFYNNKDNKTVGSYMNWAKSQYIIYQKLFYNESFSGDYDENKYKILKIIKSLETKNS